ncbi:Tim44/TimA family putative adaptor protein [Flavobacteriaceae bacterium]|nr:Tim44/TimA family putative adaptor protein [Flavobacteriaceae bacterium]
MFDIIFFAIISVLIFIRLRNQLGKTDDASRRESIKNFLKENTNHSTKIRTNGEAKIIDIRQAFAEKEVEDDLIDIKDQQLKLNIRRVLKKARTEYKKFITGVEIVFDSINKSFNSKDKESIKPFISNKIFNKFCCLIDGSDGVNRHVELLSIKKIEIKEAKIEKNFALIKIQFSSNQINYTFDDDKKLLDGSKTEEVEVENIWTFKKDCNSKSPNWVISAMKMIDNI